MFNNNKLIWKEDGVKFWFPRKILNQNNIPWHSCRMLLIFGGVHLIPLCHLVFRICFMNAIIWRWFPWEVFLLYRNSIFAGGIPVTGWGVWWSEIKASERASSSEFMLCLAILIIFPTVFNEYFCSILAGEIWSWNGWWFHEKQRIFSSLAYWRVHHYLIFGFEDSHSLHISCPIQEWLYLLLLMIQT